ncbi:MAG: nucleoside hydrolase [Chloroflexi bacterium]|nr:nucleoside hydrolase [Chloroflexota bacterium]
MSERVIIDTDPGLDDFFAIVQALRSPELEVHALTTVGGNVPLSYATRNALRALRHGGRSDVPVVPGSARPLKGRFGYAFYFHGPGGLGIPLRRPETGPLEADAVDFIASESIKSEEIALIALGPLTNVARLLQRHPYIKGKLSRLIVMGGAVDVPGNVTPHAEFNVWNDPEAAALVLSSGAPITLVGLDVCHLVEVSEADFAGADPVARRLGEAWFRRHPGKVLNLADCVAIAVASDLSVVETERVAIAVDITAAQTRGRTTRSTAGPEIDVALRVDAGRVRKVILERALATPLPRRG